MVTHSHGCRCHLFAREFGGTEAQLAGQWLDGIPKEHPSLHGRRAERLSSLRPRETEMIVLEREAQQLPFDICHNLQMTFDFANLQMTHHV